MAVFRAPAPSYALLSRGLSAVAVIVIVSACTENPPTPGRESAASASSGRIHPRDGLRYQLISSGSFEMGCGESDDDCLEWEYPRHTVQLKQDYWIGRSEVTVAAYRRFAESAGREMPPPPAFNRGWRGETHPIVRVTWEEATGYCSWIGGRLPTEAEWEYAARGGAGKSKYPWGNSIDRSMANYGAEQCCDGFASGADRWRFTAPVGSFPANAYGLFDMVGNVWEWVSDWHAGGYYQDSPKNDPRGPPQGETHGVRGGSWDDPPRFLRLSNRNKAHTRGWRYSHTGFRCVLDEWPRIESRYQSAS